MKSSKYALKAYAERVNMSLDEKRKFISEIIASSDKEVLAIFWLPFAYQNLDVNIPYFGMMINLIEMANENKLTDDDYEKIQLMLVHHWKQIYVLDGVEQFFEFLDIIDNEVSTSGENMAEVLA